MKQCWHFFGLGRSSGLIVSIGEKTTYSLPILEGFLIERGLKIGEVSGDDLTKYLETLLKKDRYK